jgi:hypothetical protein
MDLLTRYSNPLTTPLINSRPDIEYIVIWIVVSRAACAFPSVIEEKSGLGPLGQRDSLIQTFCEMYREFLTRVASRQT